MGDATVRFTDRVADYVRFRPGYPPEVIDCLSREIGLRPGHRVADLGSGTGIFTELLLDHGCTVYAVEPNREMRQAAEKRLRQHAAFVSIDASAEDTTLADGQVDWIIAAQAFHWFDVDRVRSEAIRILHPGGRAALVWNNRREDTPFLADYEAFLGKFSVDYAKVKHQNAEADGRIPSFFGGGDFAIRTFPNAQSCDLEGLLGRTFSASYMPGVDDPRRDRTVEALRGVFERHQVDGHVKIEYATRLYVDSMMGRPRRQATTT